MSQNFSVPQAENLVSSEVDQEVEGVHSGTSGTVKKVMFLKLMSSVVDKIGKLDAGFEKRY